MAGAFLPSRYTRAMHALVAACLLALPPAATPAPRRGAADVAALLTAVLRARLTVGHVHSIFGPDGSGDSPITTFCLRMKDGSEAPATVAKSLAPRYKA